MKHAVLGLLVQRPGYPYELAQRFRREVGAAWSLDTSHIYHLLEQLESEGLVVNRTGGRQRNHYLTTRDGRREFERWLVGGPVRVQPLREEMYLRIAVCPPRHFDGLIEVISVQEAATYEVLERLSAERALEAALRPPIDWKRAATQLIVAGQIARIEADLAWLRDTRSTLEWLRHQEVTWSEAARGLPEAEDEAG
jgi:DNA-binding PadR family transcriptional regulator